MTSAHTLWGTQHTLARQGQLPPVGHRLTGPNLGSLYISGETSVNPGESPGSSRNLSLHSVPRLRSSIPQHPSVFATSETPRKSIAILLNYQAKNIDSLVPGLVRYRLSSPRLSIRYQHHRPEPRELPAARGGGESRAPTTTIFATRK